MGITPLKDGDFVTIAQQMFAVVPASGAAALTAAQRQFLVGKARWIASEAEAGEPVVPTICLTRAAWAALQTERRSDSHRLRAVWVATLFKLVGSNSG